MGIETEESIFDEEKALKDACESKVIRDAAEIVVRDRDMLMLFHARIEIEIENQILAYTEVSI